ncbi:MAG: TatD family hydrolase [Clostridia bacterium]|jgi:TatD DNase family protein|nr:TatD family hydrolase [Clostridia bacterium]MCI1999828.1 TatD family hydrolase [Clostridia bacterium]MCI2014256.1 TatD family hydrolase [Clostridia bacterium]
MIFDSHAHYDDEQFDSDRDELLLSLHKNGVDFIMNSGESVRASKAGVELGKKYDFIYSAAGIHPSYASSTTDEDIKIIRKILENEKKVLALGEIGLDYHYENADKEKQRTLFKKQLSLAKELDMPVIIHSRDASQECFDIIKESGVRNGVIHCFSSSKELAAEYIKLGFFIGIGGVLTYSNARKMAEVVESAPIERILLETDCPYLAPVPNRGKRNDSSMLTYVAEKISEIKNMNIESVYSITENNALRMFRIL